MRFLYTNNNQGLFSSLTQSWIFWIVIILVVVLIFVMILRSNTDMQKKLKVNKIFGNMESDDTDLNHDESNIALIQDSVTYDINNGNARQQDDDFEMENVNNGVYPDLNKFLDADLDEEDEKSALLIGNSEKDKNVKAYYTISSKKENIFKIVDDFRDTINFKLEFRDISKLNTTGEKQMSGLKIFNQNRKCIAMFIIEPKKITVKSISPFFEDVIIDMDESTRLIAFNQISDKLYAHNLHVATLNIYDKATYFYIKSPIIKELQYF